MVFGDGDFFPDGFLFFGDKDMHSSPSDLG